MTTPLGTTGIWSGQLRYGDQTEAARHATELEQLGYATLWIPDVGGDLFTSLGNMLGATTTCTVATGILNVWMHTPEQAASAHARLVAEHGPRYMCGLGISHQPLIDRVKEPGAYQKPVAHMASYLDGLDAASAPLAAGDRMLAALGPRMLELAATRTAGTHPYLVTPERKAMTADAEKRQGFTDDDIANGGSDRLVDALVVWGDETAIARRVQEHRDAGADHVCVQVLTANPAEFPVEQWRALAPAIV